MWYMLPIIDSLVIYLSALLWRLIQPALGVGEWCSLPQPPKKQKKPPKTQAALSLFTKWTKRASNGKGEVSLQVSELESPMLHSDPQWISTPSSAPLSGLPFACNIVLSFQISVKLKAGYWLDTLACLVSRCCKPSTAMAIMYRESPS